MEINKNSGITLIALVITIIVMLILAGVSISLILDSDNGIIKRSDVSTKAYHDSKEREAIMLAYTAAKFEVLTDAVLESKKPESIDIDIFTQCLKENGNSVIVDEDGNDFLVAFVQTNNVYTVAKDGTIISVTNENNLTSSSDSKFYKFSGNSINGLSDEGKSLSRIILPDKNPDGTIITEISENAFFNNTTLRNVVLSDNINTIGESAFRKCSNLGQITISKNIANIAIDSFDNDEITIYTSPFNGCNNLNKVIFNDGLTKIPEYIFSDVKSIQKIVIPSSVIEIGQDAFTKCSTDVTIVFMGSEAQWNELKNHIGSGNSALLNPKNIIYK